MTNKVNYIVCVFSHIDDIGKPCNRRSEGWYRCHSVKDVTDTITRVATVQGWRDIEIQFAGNVFGGIPLETPKQ